MVVLRIRMRIAILKTAVAGRRCGGAINSDWPLDRWVDEMMDGWIGGSIDQSFVQWIDGDRWIIRSTERSVDWLINRIDWRPPWSCIFVSVVKMDISVRDQILPISVNWPTNYNFALFWKLPTNYTRLSEKWQKDMRKCTASRCISVRQIYFFSNFCFKI